MSRIFSMVRHHRPDAAHTICSQCHASVSRVCCTLLRHTRPDDACTHARTHARTQTHLQACTHVLARPHAGSHARTDARGARWSRARTHARPPGRTHARTHACTHTHARIRRTHTHARTHAHDARTHARTRRTHARAHGGGQGGSALRLRRGGRRPCYRRAPGAAPARAQTRRDACASGRGGARVERRPGPG